MNEQINISGLGQLLRPLPLEQVGGIWFAEDWRLPIPAGTRWDVNRLLLALVFVAGGHRAHRRTPAPPRVASSSACSASL